MDVRGVYYDAKRRVRSYLEKLREKRVEQIKDYKRRKKLIVYHGKTVTQNLIE